MSSTDALRGRIEKSLKRICEVATPTLRKFETHDLLEVTGLTDSGLMGDVATYLVGLRVDSVSSLLQIRNTLSDSPLDRAELVRNVVAIVGDPPSSLPKERKTDERNPWLAEGIWYLCLHAAHHKPTLHPYGQILALAPPHVHPKDHGFDIAGIFENGDGLGFSAVETKAYEKYPDKALSDAAATFRVMDSGGFDQRARQFVSTARDTMSDEQQSKISASLWQQRRAYIANPHYDSAAPVRWDGKRRSLRGWPSDLVMGVCLMPNPIVSFSEYFDGLSEKMYEIAQGLTSVE